MPTRRHHLCRDPRTGIYYARIQADKTRRRFTFGKDRKAAETQLRALERDLRAGRVQLQPPAIEAARPLPGDPGAPRISDLIARRLEWVRNNRSPATAQVRAHFLAAFARYVGDIPVRELNRLMLENYLAWARKHRGAGPNAGNAHLRHVKTMFIWAEEMGLCSCPVRRFPSTTETLPLTRRFSDEELGKLLGAVSGGFEDFRDMIVFGLLTGLRPQELRLLRRDQIMRDGRGEHFLFIEQHKTARLARKPVARSVPLTAEALEIVHRQVARHPGAALLFLNADGVPYKAHSFRQRFRRWCRRAGVASRPPYALRHTFGSMEAEANINQTSLSQLMGHTTIRTTTRYISNNYDHHRNAVHAIVGRVASLTQPGLKILEASP